MAAFIASFILVFLAEMADKTQLLAAAFASRYSASKVLLGVFIATLICNTLSVAIGRFLTNIIPVNIISLIAALSFIVFGLWALRGDKDEGRGKKEFRLGPVAAVAAAFFLAEMGDKTQLATISLTVEYRSILGVLAGSTLGMVSADALGIAAGTVLKKYIPEKTLRYVSAGIFILFGIGFLYRTISSWRM
ncbi:MAG: TMEM165/GDT1 family protein [Candidatus Omnitrophica bacterium]|jgi:putative Ca2+/H+ antiporter (TMEM165/GDT1 family)|nr:TMEM165/GDT1 family protein [Candidatus Omnitrophota bacterium]